MVDVALNTR